MTSAPGHPAPGRATLCFAAAAVLLASACSDNDVTNPPTFTPDAVVTYDQLKAALAQAVGNPPYASTDPNYNGGLSLNMWATVVDRAGIVVAVTYTGPTEGDQWPGSRVISAQKANTANSYSLKNLALSTANLYSAVQPGGSLFGLQEANPINEDVAFGGNASDYGTPKDYMVGKRIGGTNVFGGGFPLYDTDGNIVGGLGVSGETSCTDHNIGWKVRHILNLDNVPAGVADGGADDNIIYDISGGVSTSGFGHPHCLDATTENNIRNSLLANYPIGSAP